MENPFIEEHFADSGEEPFEDYDEEHFADSGEEPFEDSDEVLSKPMFIDKYLIPSDNKSMIISHFNYLVVIFKHAGIVVVMSHLEAYRFEYFKSVLNPQMQMHTDLKRLDHKHEQFYYIVQFDLYREIHPLAVKIFAELHKHDNVKYKIDDCHNYLTASSDHILKKKMIDGYKHLCDVFGLHS